MSDFSEVTAAGDDDLIESIGETVHLKRGGVVYATPQAAVVPSSAQYVVDLGGTSVLIKAEATIRVSDVDGAVLPGDRCATNDGELLVTDVTRGSFDTSYHLTLATT